MVTDNQKTTPVKNEQKKSGFETITERVHRHLSDIKSQITDDDIRNARIELEIVNSTTYDIFQR
jgi:hypothetical protein